MNAQDIGGGGHKKDNRWEKNRSKKGIRLKEVERRTHCPQREDPGERPLARSAEAQLESHTAHCFRKRRILGSR